MHGIEGVTGSHDLQINPYVLAQNERELINLDPLNPYFSSRGLEGTAGGEAKLIVKDSIILDGTINPDFSDVESDQPQFTVNQRYPVYFPELRPFFLENANYFTTPILLVYTRNIVHPEYGIRLTGKVGNTNLGFFAIDDREPGETYRSGRSALSPARQVRRGQGLAGSGKEFERRPHLHRPGIRRRMESHRRPRLHRASEQKLDRDRPDGRVLHHESHQPRNSRQPTPPDRPVTLEVQRTGHSFNLDTVFKDYSTGFQTQLGFIPTTDLYSDQTHATYLWYPKKKSIQSFGLDAVQLLGWDHQGNRLYHYFTFSPYVTLPRQYGHSRRSWAITPIPSGPQDGYPLTHNVNFTENFGGMLVRGAPFSQLNFFLVALRSQAT